MHLPASCAGLGRLGPCLRQYQGTAPFLRGSQQWAVPYQLQGKEWVELITALPRPPLSAPGLMLGRRTLISPSQSTTNTAPARNAKPLFLHPRPWELSTAGGGWTDR